MSNDYEKTHNDLATQGFTFDGERSFETPECDIPKPEISANLHQPLTWNQHPELCAVCGAPLYSDNPGLCGTCKEFWPEQREDVL